MVVLNGLAAAIKQGKNVWATVLRSGKVRMVPGETVHEGELLSWTYEGATCWHTVGVVRMELIAMQTAILGIDGTNWVHALWHVYGSDRLIAVGRDRLRILAAACGTSDVYVCWDRRSFRHDLLASYKSSRPPREPGLTEILKRAEIELTDDGKLATPIYQDGYEADDLLATFAAIAAGRGVKCYLASADKDLWQCLVADQVLILRSFNTSNGEITDRQWMTAAALAKWPGKDKGEYGLRPSQWTDYQALVGESGDDVPGCPGWGEKTAAKALAKAGSLADMLGNPWNVPCSKSQQAKLQTWAKSGLMALTLKLVTLARDAPAAMDAMR